MDGVAEIGIEGIHVAAIPRDLNSVSNGALDAGCGGRILLRNGGVEYLRYGVYDVTVADGQENCGAEILVAFDVGGNADLVDYLRYLSFHVRGVGSRLFRHSA